MAITLAELEAELEALAANGYAVDPLEMVRSTLEQLTPPEQISTTVSAQTTRYIATATGGKRLWSLDLTPYIGAIQDALDDPEVVTIAVPGSARSGKALAVDTPIPTPAGWTTMGDLRVGDEIFDQAGRPCRVTFATEVMRHRQCYSVEFCDGSAIVADADHLWDVMHSPHGGRSNEKTRVLTTSQMIPIYRKTNKIGRIRNTISISVAGPLECEAADLPIDPYVLGVWLGDGQSRGAAIFVHRNDKHIAERVIERGYRLEKRSETPTGLMTLGIYLPSDDPDFCNRGHDRRVEGNYAWGQCRACGRMDALHRKDGRKRDVPVPRQTLPKLLRDLGLFNNKHIPCSYLRASAEQRLDLLKGLMDTDGYIDGKVGRSVFTSTSEHLAMGVVELARSLGLKPTVSKSPAYAVVNGERREGAPAYDVGFMAYSDTPVFSLPRKVGRQRPAEAGKPEHCRRRRITAIRPVESVPVRCIQVDSPRHLFLAGEAMVPTHNTIAAENHLHKRMRFGPMTDVLWFLPGESDVETYADKDFATYFELHPEVAAKIGKGKSDNKRRLKRVKGRFVQVLPANGNTVRGKQAPFIVADEIDGFRKTLRNNMKQQLDIRGRNYGKARKGYLCSHPDAGWDGGISAIWKESSRGIWWWPCPHCESWSSPCPTADWRTKLTWTRDSSLPKDQMLAKVKDTAGLLCPHCGVLITNEHKFQMNLAGKWVFDGQVIAADGTVTGTPTQNDTAGFWIHGAMSNFVSWNELAGEYVAALVYFEESGKSDRLREVTAKSLGEPYEGPTGRRVDARLLAKRATTPDEDRGYKSGAVPPGVRFLTATADTAGDGWDILILGWGADSESWLIHRYKLVAGPDGRKLSPGTRPEDWNLLRTQVLESSYPLAWDPQHRLPIASLGVDVQGVPGATWNARRWGRNMQAAKVPGYKFRLLRGATRTTHPEVGAPQTIDRDDQGKAIEPAVIEFPLGVYKLKETVLARLALDAPGPGYMNFPEDCEPRVFDELLNEPLIDGEFVRRGPNETLDLWGYGTAVAGMLKPDRPEIDWSRPPIWARPFKPVPTKPAPQAAALTPTTPKQQAAERRQKLIDRISPR